jgi:toxin-antitoxin system PIN domain toxin
MWLPDVNVLLGAVFAQMPHHSTARAALEEAYDSGHTVAHAWVALTGFIRIATRRGAIDSPLEVGPALQIMDRWISHPRSMVIHPGPRHAAILSRLLLGAGRAGNLTTDAHLAAIAIEHGATLASFDRDFEAFAGLRFQFLKAPLS